MRKRAIRRSVLGLRIGAAVTCGVGALGLWLQPARASTPFTATAVSFGMDSAVSGSNFPLGAAAEGASPEAQAVLDSLPTSKGFAADPYPGDFVVSLPGTLAGAGHVPVPPYPLLVTSDAVNAPTGAQGGPGYSLSSTSNAQSTHATAETGAASGGTEAGHAVADAVTTRSEDGSVQADSRSANTGFAVGTTLGFGSVVTTAHAVVDSSGHLTYKSTIDVSGATINGQPVGFVDGQFVIAGTSQPLPANPFQTALQQAGISVSLVAAQNLPNGVESAGVQVTLVQQGPDGTPAAGGYTVTYTLGRSIATVDHSGQSPGGDGAAVTDGESPPAAGGSAGMTTGAAPSGQSVSADAGSPSSAALADAPAMGASAASAAPAGTSAATSAATQAATPNAQPGGAVSGGRSPLTALVARPHHLDAGNVYLALVLAGVLLVASAQLMRHLGVKSTWTS